MTTSNPSTKTVLELLDSEPLEVRDALLSHEIDYAFKGYGFIYRLAGRAPSIEWEDVCAWLREFQITETDKYKELCFMYACFILCYEGEESSF